MTPQHKERMGDVSDGIVEVWDDTKGATMGTLIHLSKGLVMVPMGDFEVHVGYDPAFLRTALMDCFDALRITGARGDGNPYRYDRAELAKVLAEAVPFKEIKQMLNEMTDEEINILLERFDQTDPALQRRIIVRYVQIAAGASDPEFIREALVGSFEEIGLIGAEHPEDSCRWSAESLAEQLAPILAERLSKRIE